MSQTVHLDQLSLAIIVVAFFALVGYRRGFLRELVAAPAILLAPFLGPWLGVALKPWVNRFYRIFLFARFGGLISDDLAGVMARVREVPALITTPEDVVRAGTVFCLLIIAAGYLIGQWRVKGPKDRAQRMLGMALGAINGYALVQVILPKLWTAQYAEVVVPTEGVLQLYRAQVVAVLVISFLVLVLFALRLARGK